MQSRDRRFTDEIDREQGHTPGVELTLEFPLDVWRSGRSFARQVEARAERQRLAIVALERQTEGRSREIALALAEAAAWVAAAEADLALREEEHRIARLHADGGADSVAASVLLEGVGTEIAVTNARLALARARGNLARRYFERAMIEGADPKELASAMSPQPATAVAPTMTGADGRRD